jgi:hypothetical protein
VRQYSAFDYQDFSAGKIHRFAAEPGGATKASHNIVRGETGQRDRTVTKRAIRSSLIGASATMANGGAPTASRPDMRYEFDANIVRVSVLGVYSPSVETAALRAGRP